MFIDRKNQLLVADHISVVLKPLGFECIDIEWSPQSRTLCVFVDRSGGIQIDHCVQINSVLLEDKVLDEMIPCEFVLEVSSPGLERPLRTLEHFRAAFDSQNVIEVKLTEKHQSRMRGRGTILAIEGQANEESTITLKTDEGSWSFPLNLVQKARQLLNWDSYSKNQLTDAML